MTAATSTLPLVRPTLGPAEHEAARRVLESGLLTQGAEVAAFEEELATYVGASYAAAVSSGTAALHLGLLAAGIGAGDEVVVPSFTFAATANAVALTGATPVFADVDADTFCLDPASVAAAVSPRTAAVVAVHLFGRMAPMDRLQVVADRHSLLLVEDAAQAHGASLGGARAGSVGDLAAFSFYATKNLTTGEGGMVTTRDPQVDRRVRLLRNQGMLERYRNEVVGFNARLTDVAAAIGRVQLRRLPELNARRRSNALLYGALLPPGLLPPAQLPPDGDAQVHAHHQLTIRSPERDALRDRLAADGIGADVFYPTPVHRLASYGLDGLSLPVTQALCASVLSLPVAPHVTPDDVRRVCEVVRAWVAR